MITLFSPFDYELNINLSDGDEEELRDSFQDIYVIILVNGVVKMRFRSEMGEDEAGNTWHSWEAGNADDAILCRLNKEDTEGWRGLVKMQVQKAVANDDFADAEEKKPWVDTPLFLVSKSAV